MHNMGRKREGEKCGETGPPTADGSTNSRGAERDKGTFLQEQRKKSWEWGIFNSQGGGSVRKILLL